ncbi:phage integrase SAM-like domain-containing protein [Gramella lutea]|uniref:Phage integrase SAM-like domain-containing protein n=1 Tax=Christiangramia lutea TaxID=1607951 RepID=A0A9X1V232_9FLAO|nr:phage integrase SAM-like domain-containing protein [Christiangramia lutea]MCH4822997.1 phage integrase SAM-like domain-containing protein [Christiangramia lutea]
MEITPKTRSAGKDHLYIFINVHDGGKYPIARPSVGVKIKKQNWNKKGTSDKKNWVKTTEPDYRRINQKIHDLMIQIEAELKGFTTKEITQQKEKKITGGKLSFFNYAEKRMKGRGNIDTKVNDQYAIKKLKKFLEIHGLIGLQFGDITRTLMNDFYRWMRNSNLKASSAKKYIESIQAMYNDALENPDCSFDLKGHQKNPFHRFKYDKEISATTPKSFTKKEFECYVKAVLPENVRKPHKYKLCHNMSKFQFWGAFRVRDIMLLKWSNLVTYDDHINVDFFTSKGKNHINRPLPPSIILLLANQLDKYVTHTTQKLGEFDKQIEYNQQEYERTQKSIPPVNKIPNDVLIDLLKKGYSLEDITNQKFHPIHKKLKKLEKKIESLFKQKQGYVEDILRGVIKNHPDEYIWDWGNESCWGERSPEQWTNKDLKTMRSNINSYSDYIDRIAKKAGVDRKISSHITRHTASQMMFDEGMTAHQAGEYLTHKWLSTTEKYRGRFSRKNDEISEGLSNLIN